MIEPDDVVLIKVNAQWKYRGCTNSDLIPGLIRAILDQPDGFSSYTDTSDNTFAIVAPPPRRSRLFLRMEEILGRQVQRRGFNGVMQGMLEAL